MKKKVTDLEKMSLGEFFSQVSTGSLKWFLGLQISLIVSMFSLGYFVAGLRESRENNKASELTRYDSVPANVQSPMIKIDSSSQVGAITNVGDSNSNSININK